VLGRRLGTSAEREVTVAGAMPAERDSLSAGASAASAHRWVLIGSGAPKRL
jgi:hypothetical protein